MKNLCLILIAVLFSGCASSPVIGPFSGLAARSNEKAQLIRSIQGSDATAELKTEAFKAVRYGAGAEEIGAGIGFDVLSLIDPNLTAGEIMKSAGGAVADLVLYAGVAAIGGEIYQHYSKDDSRSVAITVNGNENQINMNTGDYAESVSDDNRQRSSVTSQ